MKAEGLCECGCEQKVKKRFVHNHHMRRPVMERFWEKVVAASEGCWEWASRRGGGGYGKFYWDGQEGYAHRFSYLHFVGDICAPLELDHLCENLWCVNPDHLEQVTHRENLMRGNFHNSLASLEMHRPSRAEMSRFRKIAVKTQARAASGRWCHES